LARECTKSKPDLSPCWRSATIVGLAIWDEDEVKQPRRPCHCTTICSYSFHLMYAASHKTIQPFFFHNYTNYGNTYANRLEDMYGIGIQYSIVESKNTSNDKQHNKHGHGYEQ
jgi:hypothetical protein